MMKVKGEIKRYNNIGSYWSLTSINENMCIDDFKRHDTHDQAKVAAEAFASKHNFIIDWED